MPTASDAQFSQRLATAIARQPLTLEQIAERLAEAGTPVSLATLSYWQRGRSLPTRESSLQVLDALEQVLRLPVGHLRGSLPSDAFSRWDELHALPAADRARGLLQAMGLDPFETIETVYIHDHVHVMADRVGRVETTTEFLLSLKDGLQATALLLGISPDEEVPVVQETQGCELGRVVMLPDLGLMAIELLLPQPVALGEPFLRGITLRWISDDAVSGDLPHVLGRSMPLVVLEATFDEAPTRAWYETTPNQWDAQSPADEPLRQALDPTRDLQLCLADPPAGWHSLCWEYADD